MRAMTRTQFLNRLIGITGLGFLTITEIEAKQKAYLLHSFVAGFRFHKGMELLPMLQEGDLLQLKREADNEHDQFAVALYWQQEMIGYLPSASNEIIARLLDAEALPLVGIITHLNKDAKPWENVSIAVYLLQSQSKQLPAYLTTLAQPVYTTIKKKGKNNKERYVPDVLEYYDRVIAVDDIQDEAARAYFKKYYGSKQMVINNRRYLLVPDDGIYQYMYNVDSKGWITNEEGKEFLEFVFNEE